MPDLMNAAIAGGGAAGIVTLIMQLYFPRKKRGTNPVGYFTTYTPVIMEAEEPVNGIVGGSGHTPSATGIWEGPPIALHGLVRSAAKAFEVRSMPMNARHRDTARVWFWASDGSVTEVFETTTGEKS